MHTRPAVEMGWVFTTADFGRLGDLLSRQIRDLASCHRDCRKFGGAVVGRVCPAEGLTGWGSRMGWVLRLVETGVEGSSRSIDVMEISRPGDLDDITALGLTLAQGKQLVALVQQEIVTAQSRDHA